MHRLLPPASMHRLLPARSGDKLTALWWSPASSSNYLCTPSVPLFQRGGERAGGVGETVFGCTGSGRDAADVRIADNKRRIGAVLLTLAVITLFSTSATTGSGSRSYSRLLVGNNKNDFPLLLDSAAFKAATTTTTTAAVGNSASNATPPPVVIALMNRFYFGDRYARVVPGCTWEKTGASLPCEFTADQARFNESSALAFHIPGMSEDMLNSAQKFLMKNAQALVGVSMESASNYPLLAHEKFLSRFDLLVTLAPPEEKDREDEKEERERGSTKRVNDERPFPPKRIWYPYYDDMFRRCWEAEGNPAAATAAAAMTKSSTTSSPPPPPPPSLRPFHLRRNAIAYVNSNCATNTGRDEVVKEMADVLKPFGVPLHSFGACLNNMPLSLRADSKIDTLRRYKFCVAIENSEDKHYVTEKVYDALVAGCVPIYFGAPNVLEYVPHADAIIDVRALRGARRAADEIARLAADDDAYAAKHAWRGRPETWSDGFKRLQAHTWKDGVGPFERCDTTAGLSDPHMRRQCAICRAVATWRREKEKKR